MRGRREPRQRGVIGMVRKFLTRGARQRQPPAAGGSGPTRPSRAIADPAVAEPSMLDEEAGNRPRRRLQPDGSHAMFGGYDDSDGDDDGEGLLGKDQTSFSRQELDRLLEARERTAFASREHEQEDAKLQILGNSKNPQDLLHLADNLIDEDWLGTGDEMPGNIYRIGAYGGLAVNSLQNMSRLLGAFIIWAVQFVGPPAVFFSSVGYGVGEEQVFKWSEWTNWGDDSNMFDHLLVDWKAWALPKLLSTIFIFLFTLNGLFVLIDEKESFKKMDKMLRYLDHHTPVFNWSGEWLLYVDSLMNNWLIIWCTLDCYILIGNVRTVKDVLFDSLGLLFLYNLDDISGDLGFVNSDDWDGFRLRWIYDNMVVPKFDPRVASIADEDEEMEASSVFLCIYDVTIGLLAIASIAMPILTIFTPFSVIGVED